MRLVDGYPIIVTERLAECREFYSRWFGFRVAFEASWFVLLQNTEEHPLTLAFMHPDHPSAPPTPATFRGDGAFLTFQVDDAAKEYERLRGAGMRFDLALKDEPWGQRRFGVVDPAGMWLDVVEQIEPQAGWWDPYLTAPQ